MEINDIPKAWRHALASVQVKYPDAVIAGGCLRDREAGVKVKDIDIFVPSATTALDEGRAVRRVLAADGWPNIDVVNDRTYNGSRIAISLETKFPGCPPINIIVAPYNIDEFDFGICQIEFNGKRIHRTPAYIIDLKQKQFRLIPVVSDCEFIRSMDRWARLKEKFLGWKLHLGSRAVTHPFVPPKTPLVFQHMDMPGVTSMQQARRWAGVASGGSTTARLDIASRPDAAMLIRSPGEYVLPKAVAERLAKETTAQITNYRSDAMVTVKLDERAITPSRKIIQEMVEARLQLERDMARRRADHR